MRRHSLQPREDWTTKVERLGMIYHHTDGLPYWQEAVAWEFSAAEIETLERATNELWARCLEAVEHVIARDRFAELGIPLGARPLIVSAWEDDVPSVYARLDLAWTGEGGPKLLEINADTPTMLLEAAVIQWDWLQEVMPGTDQFNSIHERLIEKWRSLKPYLQGDPVHFTHGEAVEDLMTVTYLRDTAEQGGVRTEALQIDDLGWDAGQRAFVDQHGTALRSLFKLYPWEWLWSEAFAVHLHKPQMQWIEPMWKMVLSNKAILPILWELFPDHPNLLPAYADGPRDLKAWVAKPRLGREGNNLIVVDGEGRHETDGPYGDEPKIYQAKTDLAVAGGQHMLVGSWLIDGEAAGIGIRESPGLVTRNESPFVPHFFRA